MTRPPRVSVNLCCYNSEKYLEETLQSVFGQTYTDWELVVVNDGSTDSTARIVERHVAAGRRIVYHAQANGGLAAARNKAIELSSCEFIALIDHDDLWHPEKLAKQMALFAERPRAGLVYSRMAGLVEGRTSPTPVVGGHAYRGDVLAPLVLRNFVPCSSIVIRRAALDKVGCFNPDFRQVEEYDLAIRIAEHYEFDYVDQTLLTVRTHPQNASWDGFRLQDETIAMMRQVLERAPHLAGDFGAAVTRIKRAGLPCKLGAAYLLRGHVRDAVEWYGGLGPLVAALPRTLALVAMSWLPHHVVARAVGVGYRLWKWLIVRGP